MATFHKCSNTDCLRVVRTKYSRCDTCRAAGVGVQTPQPVIEAPKSTVEGDRNSIRLAKELAAVKDKYKDALKTIEELESEQQVNVALADPRAFAIEPQRGSGSNEGTVVWVASDWHMEERVDPATVSGLNTYSLDIAERRAPEFFRAGLRLTKLLQQDIKIDTIVLALLGDFISGDIHEEIAEVCAVPPTEAIVIAQQNIISGIEFVLDNSDCRIVVKCHSGNHARTTKTTRFATENGHSLEYLMYLHLAAYFRNEERVTVDVAPGMHSYLDIYDLRVRFQHGHAIKYGGGVGGIYVPVNKAIAQWNKARMADLDIFGHFHQLRDGGNFVCNGSMIGYNTFALSIKADYELPRQTLLLIDKKRGRTCTWPILFSKE